VGQLHAIHAAPAPTFADAAAAFVTAHATGGARATNTTVTYRQTLTGPATRLVTGPVGADLAALDTFPDTRRAAVLPAASPQPAGRWPTP
jgi:hypothetical protein